MPVVIAAHEFASRAGRQTDKGLNLAAAQFRVLDRNAKARHGQGELDMPLDHNAVLSAE